MDPYSPAQRDRGRRSMIAFEVINTFSFSLLAGNIITLLMLRLGAQPLLIGVLSAFPYLAFLFMPLAKGLVPRLGLVRIFGRAWLGRYLVILPIVAAPLVAGPWGGGWGIVLIMGPYMLFQMVRGFGLVSISPLNNYLSMGKDQGDWLSLKSMVVSGSSIGTGVLVGLLLGPDAPLERYTLFMVLGILLGLVGTGFIFAIPEPRGSLEGVTVPLMKDLVAGLNDLGFRRFLGGYALLIFLTGLGRPFLIVYAKQVFLFGDDGAMILTVIGTLGAIVMGSLSRLAMDRLGAKPLLVFWTLAFFSSLAILTFLPVLSGAPAWVVLSLLFFVNTLGGAGIENASQSYFFQVVKPERQFNLGMVYYLVMGLTGALGSLLGGAMLGALKPLAGTSGAFSLFFAFTALLTLGSLVPLGRMANLGARRVSDALGRIFSPRDLRTMDLLRRLDSTGSPAEEESLMRRLPSSRSDLAVEESIKRLSSPLYAIRAQALLSLERLPLTPEAEEALICHVEDHPFATAYRAARILGERGSQKAIPSLRKALASEDYLLQAHAAGALGHLGDAGSRLALENLLHSPETLVIIQAVGALKELGDPRSFSPILGCMDRPSVPYSLRDEVVFALAGFLECEQWLYPIYLDFLEDPDRGWAHLDDGVETGLSEERKAAVRDLLKSAVGTSDACRESFRRLREEGLLDRIMEGRFVQALTSAPSPVWDMPRFRFFLSAAVVEAATRRRVSPP